MSLDRAILHYHSVALKNLGSQSHLNKLKIVTTLGLYFALLSTFSFPDSEVFLVTDTYT